MTRAYVKSVGANARYMEWMKMTTRQERLIECNRITAVRDAPEADETLKAAMRLRIESRIVVPWEILKKQLGI